MKKKPIMKRVKKVRMQRELKSKLQDDSTLSEATHDCNFAVEEN